MLKTYSPKKRRQNAGNIEQKLLNNYEKPAEVGFINKNCWNSFVYKNC